MLFLFCFETKLINGEDFYFISFYLFCVWRTFVNVNVYHLYDKQKHKCD